MRGHPRTMAYRKLLVGARSVAPQCLMQHLMPCTFQCGLSCAFSNDRQNKKAKTWKSAFPRGRAKVAFCGWPGDLHELHKLGGIRSALRKRAALRKQTQANTLSKVVRTMRGLLRLIMSQKQQTRKSASLMCMTRTTCLRPQHSDPVTATW